MKVLVIIPARGGSKGVPGKNSKVLGNKPLIAHAIDCAKKSNKVNKIIVSTDAVEIANIALEYGSEVVMRPAELAEDTSNVVTAVEHVYKSLNEKFEIIILLQPTSPFRTTKDLDTIIEMFENDQTLESVISVIALDDFHPARMYCLDKNQELIPFIDNGESTRRQDLEPVYYRNGCFYAIKTEVFLKEKSFMVSNKKAYIMDANWLANIDSLRDFKFATFLYDEWKNEIINN